MSKTGRVISSAVIGNALEWYDYLLYACFAGVIGHLFFPSDNPYTSMMMTFGVFAIGFFARPIGGIIFGYIGDEFGRKVALTTSILLIAIPTTLMGLLPTYEQIGIMAPILLLVMRILQGISLGGEFSASTTFLVESSPNGKEGLFGSFSTSSVAIGMLMASSTVFILNKFFSPQQIENFAWRIPFLFSFVIGFVAFYIRRNLEESHAFLDAKKHHELSKTPFREIFTTYRINLLSCLGIFMGGTIPFYTILIFSKTMMTETLGYSAYISSALNVVAIISFMVFCLFFGWLSDKLNGKKILICSAICMMIFICLFAYSLKLHNIYVLFLMFILGGIMIATYMGVAPTLMVRSFPVTVRSCGVSLSYGIAAALFGGTAPLILTFLVKEFNNIFVISCYVIFGAFCSILALIIPVKQYN